MAEAQWRTPQHDREGRTPAMARREALETVSRGLSQGAKQDGPGLRASQHACLDKAVYAVTRLCNTMVEGTL